jgi:thioester reductase-like protein
VALVLMTGFPGFLGAALLPRLLARDTSTRVVCVVQPQHLATARRRVAAADAARPGTAGRVDLVEGDVTSHGLGLPRPIGGLLDAVTEVWHLAAVYDLAVPAEVAHRVDVGGTANVLALCRTAPALRRLHHVSTCYVSGRHAGEFTEDDLDTGQSFRNHYEATKFEAEVLVREAVGDGLPATVYRPGIVVGDSRTGETQKYDGPYFLASFLRRQLPVAVVPAVAAVDRVTVTLVPRDFVVDAMDRLSALDTSVGRTYALADPRPPTVRELVDAFAGHLGRKVVWVRLPLGPTRLVIGSVPGLERLLGLPAESLDYFAASTTYSTAHTVADLAGTGVECPPFESYAGTLIRFMTEHPEIDASAMA